MNGNYMFSGFGATPAPEYAVDRIQTGAGAMRSGGALHTGAGAMRSGGGGTRTGGARVIRTGGGWDDVKDAIAQGPTHFAKKVRHEFNDPASHSRQAARHLAKAAQMAGVQGADTAEARFDDAVNKIVGAGGHRAPKAAARSKAHKSKGKAHGKKISHAELMAALAAYRS